MFVPGTRQRLTGWGRTAPSVATVVRPASRAEASAALDTIGARGVTARGLGRAYGDAAQNGGGTVLDCTALDAIGAVDAERGTVVAGGGASLDAIGRAIAAHGWVLPVVPGTRIVTVGGAIAADVHGKGHHRDGSFGAHVEAITLVLPDGETREVTRASDRALFDATTGGMGLTGVIAAATLRLERASGTVRVTTTRTRDLDATMLALVEADARHRYSVAWIDLVGGRGRGIVGAADRIDLDAPSARGEAGRRALRLAVPAVVPVNLVRHASVRAFNELWLRRPIRAEALQSFDAFNAPLDALGAWPRLYGPRGLLQYQCALPIGADAALRTIVEAIADGAPAVPAFAVLKRLGAAGDGPLSFPIEGWTLAVDFPAGAPALGAFLDTLDERVAAAGGRVYLAKDARMRAEMVPLMYPRIDEWRETQARVDPRGVLTSDLDRRLGLTRGATRGPR